MKTRFTWAIVLLVATGALGVLAAQSSRGKTQLEAARKLLVVDGNLQGAIKQYTAIAETFKSDHAVAAEALLALAQAYRRSIRVSRERPTNA